MWDYFEERNETDGCIRVDHFCATQANFNLLIKTLIEGDQQLEASVIARISFVCQLQCNKQCSSVTKTFSHYEKLHTRMDSKGNVTKLLIIGNGITYTVKLNFEW